MADAQGSTTPPTTQQKIEAECCGRWTPQWLLSLVGRHNDRPEIRDPKCPGLRARIGRTAITFRYGVRVTEGGSRWINLGELAHPACVGRQTVAGAQRWVERLRDAQARGTLHEVEQELREELAEGTTAKAARRGEAPVPPASQGQTVREAFSEFYALRLSAGAEKRRRPELMRENFERDVFPLIGDLACRAVTEEDCRHIIYGLTQPELVPVGKRTPLVKERIAGGKRGAVHASKVYDELEQFFAWARRAGKAMRADGTKASSPMEDLLKGDLGVEAWTRRQRWLRTEELPLLWEAVCRRFTPAKLQRHGAGYGGKQIVESLQRRGGLSPVTGLAIRFLLTVPVRSHSLLMAERSELDLPARLWRIPCDHLKLTTAQIRARDNQPMVVPLSDLALQIVGQLLAVGGRSRYLTPSPGNTLDKDEPLSDRALSKAMCRMFRKGHLELPHGPARPHDLRRTARTHMTTKPLGIDSKIAERCLGHEVAGTVERTYDCGDYLEEKRAALDAWGARLSTLVGADSAVVLPLKRSAS